MLLGIMLGILVCAVMYTLWLLYSKKLMVKFSDILDKLSWKVRPK